MAPVTKMPGLLSFRYLYPRDTFLEETPTRLLLRDM